ncbi:excinuclease ABC subunit UvrC [Clostridium sp. KNHs214]|uniref:excinuclease ABC subunit UvrC n=1 Tax=Clostridium sp. KNHs214 TaxID=1540257 RepID=UPI00054DD2B5|nr:excinuclease ABC subunit UvrC [Clostridium sp. KNHs214]
MFDFEYHLKMLPEKPGVYIMKNSIGTVIYVGKAKILKNRVKQYFQSSKNHPEKVRQMVKNISEFEYIVTDSEMEALILECNLIKKYKPKYNILLKDDKGYPFIKITLNEDFPRVIIARNKVKDGAKYFGPYPEYSVVKEIILLIKKIFPLRTCKKIIKSEDVKLKAHIKPCLNYHIGICKAPCAGYISKDQYGKIVDNIIELLLGKDKTLKNQLQKEMMEASKNLQFEKAASLRDKLEAVNKVCENQKIIFGNFENEDYINLYMDEKDTCIQVFFLRNGKIIGREHFIFEDTAGNNKGNIISTFIKEFYGGTAFIPKNILVPDIEEGELLEQWLSLKKEGKVEIKMPVKGKKHQLMQMVMKNAKITLEGFKLKYIMDKEMNNKTLEEFTEILNLKEIPERIEAYDISNIQGVDSVGSMVVFENGKPKSSDYRRFKIKEVIGPNDYDSMREILRRRFSHGFKEIEEIKEKNLQYSVGKFCVFPDLILMDGGLGQVNIAYEVLREYNLEIPVCGMVKDDKHRTRGLIYEGEEIILNRNSSVMKLITRIQDEVHRFAITYHRSLRQKRVLHSVLEDIPLIGAIRRKELLKKFGSIDNIKKASYEELISTPSINMQAADSIMQYFRKSKGSV